MDLFMSSALGNSSNTAKGQHELDLAHSDAADNSWTICSTSDPTDTFNKWINTPVNVWEWN